ncbi:MAG: cell wall hydrolase [Limnochordia bacterium]
MQYSEQDIKRTLAVSLSAYLLYFALFSGALVGTGVEATVSEAVEASAEAAAVPQTLPAEEAEAKLALAPDAQENLQPGEPAQQEALGTYRVQRGDTLYWIAAAHDMTVDELKAINGLESEVIRPGQTLTVSLATVREYPAGVRLSDQEVKWLAQMIYAEARGEPYVGQVAVGAVILNRLKSPKFPNTMYGVLFQQNAFQPISNGSFFREPNERAVRAAQEALMGHDPTNGALFFFNPRQSQDRFMHSRPATVTIGQHRFMN